MNRLQIAADGASKGNPGPAGWGWYADPNHFGSGGSKHATNNEMELTAVREALKAVKPKVPLELVCDSQYVINCLTKWVWGWSRNGWKTGNGKPVSNRELIEEIVDLLKGRDYIFTWVKGHAGHPLNEAADKLASREAESNRG